MEFSPLLRQQSVQLLLLWFAFIGLVLYNVHQWTASFPISLRFFMGVVVGIAVVFLCHLSFWRLERIRKEREGYARQMINLSKEDLFRLLPENAAKTASSKKPDQFNWLNIELAKAWPFLNEAAADAVRHQLQPVLDQYKMGALAEMTIKSISFGVASPQFLGVKMEEMGEDEASVEADLQWRADKEKIVVKVKTLGPDFKVKIQNIKVWATVKLTLKPLTEIMPCFGAILVSFSGVPVIDFDVRIAKGDANAFPGIDKMIDNSIRTAVEDMLVWPNRIVCPVLPGDYSFLELHPVGILDVFLLRAEGVMNTDILGKSDCFVFLFVRKKPERIKRSTTKKNSLRPVWNEGFRIEVDDPQNQVLTIQLMDEESITKADFIGLATVPLKNLVPHEPKDMWLDMMEGMTLQCKKPRAHVHVVLLYKPFEGKSSHDPTANEDGTLTKTNEHISQEIGQFEMKASTQDQFRGNGSVSTVINSIENEHREDVGQQQYNNENTRSRELCQNDHKLEKETLKTNSNKDSDMISSSDKKFENEVNKENDTSTEAPRDAAKTNVASKDVSNSDGHPEKDALTDEESGRTRSVSDHHALDEDKDTDRKLATDQKNFGGIDN